MYRIDSMYEAMIEALLAALAEGTATRWMAAVAWWLSRQQVFGATDYWQALAAMITNELSPDEFEAIVAQLSKQEDGMLDTVTAWPELPATVAHLVEAWTPAPPDLAAVKADASARIDAAAERYRLQFLTGGAGQAMAYQQKHAEAEAYLADPAIDPAEVPHIVAEAAATGMSPADKARQIIATFAAWQQISARVEAARAAAKQAVAAAETVEAVRAAANVNWEGGVA